LALDNAWKSTPERQSLAESTAKGGGLPVVSYGLALLPDGKRRDELTLRFDALVTDLFGAGVYDFTTAAAERCASIMAGKRALGEPLDDHLPDAMIAGIAAQAGLPVATRNRAEFRNCGLVLIDPWAAED